VRIDPENEIQWVIRQTGLGQRSWAYDASKVHLRDPARLFQLTRCGLRIPGPSKRVNNPEMGRCKRCFK
jgi:hypothetical protein